MKPFELHPSSAIWESRSYSGNIPKEELEKYWAGIFSRKLEGVVKIDTVKRPSDISYSTSISRDEVKEGLRSLKDNSPGPDGLKKSDVIKIPIQILHSMLLIFPETGKCNVSTKERET